jgi:hypothetical protein
VNFVTFCNLKQENGIHSAIGDEKELIISGRKGFKMEIP